MGCLLFVIEWSPDFRTSWIFLPFMEKSIEMIWMPNIFLPNKLSECESILWSRYEFLFTLLLPQESVRLRCLSGMSRQTPFHATMLFGHRGLDWVNHLASSSLGHDIFLTFILSLVQTSSILTWTSGGVLIHSWARVGCSEVLKSSSIGALLFWVNLYKGWTKNIVA